MIASRTLLLLSLALLAAPAQGADLRAPGHVRLEPLVEEDVVPDVPIGIDIDGYAYFGSEQRALVMRLDDPLDSGELSPIQYNPSGGHQLYWGMQQGDVGVVALKVHPAPIPGYDDETARAVYFRAVHLAGLPWSESRELITKIPLFAESWPFADEDLYDVVTVGQGLAGRISEGPEGDLCIASRLGILCIRPRDPEPVWRLAIDARELDALLGPSPAHRLDAIDTSSGLPILPEEHYWTVEEPLLTSDGRMFFLAERFQSDERHGGVVGPSLRYVVERTPDGVVRARLGPVMTEAEPTNVNEDKEPSALQGATKLLYDARLDAVLAWPIHGAEWSHYKFPVAGVSLNPKPLGAHGLGFRVIPREGPGGGYLSATDAIVRRYHCKRGGYLETGCFFAQGYPSGVGPQAFPLPGGEIGVMIRQEAATDPDPPSAFRLVYDAGELDLDGDMLTADEEAALGSSDLLRDTDGGGLPDGVEHRRAGTDPADGADDPAGARARLVTYVASSLLKQRIPLGALDWPSLRTPGAKGPFCADGQCWGPDGRVVATYPKQGANHPGKQGWRALDGSFLVWPEDDGLYRMWFDDGRKERWFAAEDYTGLVGDEVWLGYAWGVVPIDAARALLYRRTRRPVCCSSRRVSRPGCCSIPRRNAARRSSAPATRTPWATRGTSTTSGPPAG